MKDKLVTIETLDGNENMLVFENPIGLMGYYVKKENIKDLIRKPNVNNAGFYFLLKDKIIKYVGQGNKRSDKSGVIKRLLEHNEDYWNQTIIFVDQDHKLCDGRSNTLNYIEKTYIDRIGLDSFRKQEWG